MNNPDALSVTLLQGISEALEEASVLGGNQQRIRSILENTLIAASAINKTAVFDTISFETLAPINETVAALAQEKKG